MQVEQNNEKHKVIVEKTIDFVKKILEGSESGHDFDHIERVLKLSRTLASLTENPGNILVIELGALMHDVYDHKFCDDESKGPTVVKEFLSSIQCDENVIDKVIQIMQKISFGGAHKANKMDFIEGLIVQDADRLDAIGAVGIARTFSYGGYKCRRFYNPEEIKQVDLTKPPIKNGATITHFYEKLLLLKEKLNTDAARKIAQERHIFMEQFLERFFAEVEGKM